VWMAAFKSGRHASGATIDPRSISRKLTYKERSPL
jgi:hypothetical protein